MKIQVRQATTVKPAAATPSTSMWISNLDAAMPDHHHTLVAVFYRYNGAPNFFDSTLLQATLGRALVHFYPVAGRLRWNNNRIEINCNAEGALFLDAEADGPMDDLGDFSPRPGLSFAPEVDYSMGISTFPLFLVQVTRFKCGGVCLGVAMDHHLCDGAAALHFFNTWADMSRGLDITALPFFDRRILSARSPSQPQFSHIEHQPYPTLNNNSQHKNPPIQKATIFKRFRLTRDEVEALKSQCKENDGNTEVNYYSTYEVVVGHAWRCVTAARGLPEDQATKMFIAVNGRPRMRPPLPKEYFGNALFPTTPIATAGELLSAPLESTVRKIHDAVVRIDHDYMVSALDYLETCGPRSIAIGSHTSECPNMMATSWAKLPFYKADFGWGRPVYVGPGSVQWEGKTYVMESPENDGSVWVAVALPEDQMKVFEKAFYGGGLCRSKI